MKNLLFICPTQYGYNTDYYKYCECLTNQYNIYYLGIKSGYKKTFETKNVKVIEVTHDKYFCGILSLFVTAFKLSRKVKFDKVIIYYTILCSLFLLIFGRLRTIVDIRTAYIGGTKKAYYQNTLLKIETNLFKKITVISEGVADFLKLNPKKIKILPLGADTGVYASKSNDLKLLYVGTFNDRNIDVTIKAVDSYIGLTHNKSLQYYIVGCGNSYETKKIEPAIESCNNISQIHYEGEKRGKELIPYYEKCNIGVAYVPLRDYYDKQPPTKTYEYLLNSMAVIATPTTENKKVISELNGIVLDGEDEGSFIKGLSYMNTHIFDTKKIYNENLQYSWQTLTQKYLLPILQ